MKSSMIIIIAAIIAFILAVMMLRPTTKAPSISQDELAVLGLDATENHEEFKDKSIEQLLAQSVDGIYNGGYSDGIRLYPITIRATTGEAACSNYKYNITDTSICFNLKRGSFPDPRTEYDNTSVNVYTGIFQNEGKTYSFTATGPLASSPHNHFALLRMLSAPSG